MFLVLCCCFCKEVECSPQSAIRPAVDKSRLERLLAEVQDGRVSAAEAVRILRNLPFEDLTDLAKIDHHRTLRTGFPEVVFGEGKSAEQISAIMERIAAVGEGALATRVERNKGNVVLSVLASQWPTASYDPVSRTVMISGSRRKKLGRVAIVSAGTSDTWVAKEAAATAQFLGMDVEYVDDVGVAGLPRLVQQSEKFSAVGVVIAIAGMEGALPSVVSGLTDCPVIAVPTSVGYGVGLGGYVAMMSMLASCSPGISVVNIDNGFGAAMAAARMLRCSSHTWRESQ